MCCAISSHWQQFSLSTQTHDWPTICDRKFAHKPRLPQLQWHCAPVRQRAHIAPLNFLNEPFSLPIQFSLRKNTEQFMRLQESSYHFGAQRTTEQSYETITHSHSFSWRELCQARRDIIVSLPGERKKNWNAEMRKGNWTSNFLFIVSSRTRTQCRSPIIMLLYVQLKWNGRNHAHSSVC